MDFEIIVIRIKFTQKKTIQFDNVRREQRFPYKHAVILRLSWIKIRLTSLRRQKENDELFS